VDLQKDNAIFLHLIGPEPHPLWPYANFDSGSMKMNFWSTYGQPLTFEERVTQSASRVAPLLHEDVILLVEYLDGKEGKYNNPVWCSYSHGARSAFLIGQDGIIIEAQEWFNKDSMIKAIRTLQLDDSPSPN